MGWCPEDSEDTLGNELKQLGNLIKGFEKNPDDSHEMFLYQIICETEENGFILKCTFPNCEVLLRIYVSIIVTNSSSERSFLKMKFINNSLLTRMSVNPLANLALMSIENYILHEIDFEDIIKDFAFEKLPKVSIL